MAGLVEEPFPQADETRAERVLAGDLVVYRRVPAMMDLVDLARACIEDAFAGHPPPTAHLELRPGDYLDRCAAMRRAWRRDPRVRAHWAEAFEQVGVRTDRLYYDWFTLRAVPPRQGTGVEGKLQLPPHRDSWGSNVYQQMNWWAPVAPISAAGTLAVYPDFWSRATVNTSATWDLAELRRLPASERARYPRLAELRETIDESTAVPVVIDPGDVLCFSAQHLHGSRVPAVGQARFNIEARTVNIDDVRVGRAAPNADGAAPHVAWDWFKRITDGRSLADDLGL
jgi:hypothetical protein